MKIICDCGNEMAFEIDNEAEESEYGIYVKKDFDKFDFWAGHDEAGMTCQKCEKAIWYFT